MKKKDAIELLRKYLKDDKMVKHCIAVGAVMRAFANRLGEDEDLWELVGLLHDIDYDITERDPARHGLKALEILEGKLPKHALEAIAAHNEHNGFKPETEEAIPLAHALRAADHVSGLIIATALVMPNKKLAEIKHSTLRRKFKQKDFARRIDRERIRECEKLGVELNEFLILALEAMKKVSRELGL